MRLGRLQAHAGEGLAAVGRLVDAVAPGDAVADAFLARPDPDDVGVLLEEGDVADRSRAVLFEDRLPGRPGVDRLEDAAGGRGDQDLGEVVVERLEVGDAADHVGRADRAPAEMVGEVRGFGPTAGAVCGAANEPVKAMTRKRAAETLRAVLTPFFMPTSFDIE